MTRHGLQVDCAPAHQEFRDFERVTSLEVPQKGSDRLRLGRNLKAGALVWLGSDTIMQENFAPDGELLRVRFSRNGTVWFDEPFRRTWHGPAVVPIGAPIIPELSLKGGSGPLSICLAQHVTVENWIVPDGWDGARALSFQSFRHLTLRKIRVGRANQTGPGQGYGVQVQRGSNFLIEDCFGSMVRHAISPFGVAFGVIRRVAAELPAGDGIDFGHGFGEEDLDFEACDSGDTNAPVGNKFLWGSRGITIRNHRNCRDLLCYGNTSCRIEGGKFSGMLRLFANQAGKRMEVEVKGWPFAKGFLAENDADYRLVVSGPVVQSV